jgi:hypothetical protein
MANSGAISLLWELFATTITATAWYERTGQLNLNGKGGGEVIWYAHGFLFQCCQSLPSLPFNCVIAAMSNSSQTLER